jgi:CHAD domain-containing protein
MPHATTRIEEALAAAIARQGRVLATAWSLAIDGDVRGVHRARVATRRVREALAMVEAAGASHASTRARRLARRLTRALGPVREMDVALAELGIVARAHRWPADAESSLRRWLQDRRTERRRALRRSLAAIGRRSMRARLASAASDLDARALDQVVRRHLLRRAERVRRHAAECGTLYAPDRLHALRIAVKKLRYTIEIATPLAGDAAAPALRALRAAQRHLGRLHDAQVLMQAIQGLTLEAALAASQDWAARLDDLERDCREEHARIVRLTAGLERHVRAVQREVSLTFVPERRTMLKARSSLRTDRATPRDRQPATGRST